MNQAEQPWGEHPEGGGWEVGGESAVSWGWGLVVSQESLSGMESPRLPAVVPISSFTSCNLSFAILKMGIMQMVPHE